MISIVTDAQKRKKKSRKENAKDKHHDYVYYTLINTFAK